MMEQKIDPPNLGFWTLAVIYFHFILAIFQNYQCDASETWKCWKETIEVKISKAFFKSFFLYDGAKSQPIQPRFLNYCGHLLSCYSCNFSKKNQLDAIGTGKFLMEAKVVKKSKKIFLNLFFYMKEQKIDPLTWVFELLPKFTFILYLQFFKKKSVGCKWNMEMLKWDKRGKNFKSFFYIIFSLWWSKTLKPQPRFLKSCCNLLSYCACNFKTTVGCKWNWKILNGG